MSSSTPLTSRERANQALLEQIQAVFSHSRNTYGGPRIYAALRHQGITCGNNRVARLMRLHGIVARTRTRRHPVTIQRQAGAVPAPNRLNRGFLAEWPNQKWVSDIPYIDTAEGWLYLAIVIDLFSRKVVGWAMGNKIDSQLVEAALRMAWRTRKPLAG